MTSEYKEKYIKLLDVITYQEENIKENYKK